MARYTDLKAFSLLLKLKINTETQKHRYSKIAKSRSHKQLGIFNFAN